MSILRSTAFLAAVLFLAGPVAAQSGAAGGQDGPPPQGTQYVFINSQALLAQAPGATEAQQTWARELNEYRGEVESLRAELDSLQQAYQQQEEMLSQDARERRQQEIVEKQQELQQRAQELEQRAAQRQQELLNPILADVRSVIEEIRQERGYAMVFDAASSGLLAADPSLDITEMVVSRLQAQTDTTDDATSLEGGGDELAGS